MSSILLKTHVMHRFNGVSLNLVRKFAKQILRSLAFFAREDVDIIHCDLKPENILLKHPRRSGIKIIDLGSSCFATKRTYTYIQSRFYRSPEILFGLPYDQKIDIWSLGCVLVEMHTGEPLFAGSNQPDQICKIVDVLGLPPVSMLNASESSVRSLFFDKIESTAALPVDGDPRYIIEEGVSADDGSKKPSLTPTSMAAESNVNEKKYKYVLKRPVGKTAPVPSTEEGLKKPPKTLREIIGVDIGGPCGRRKFEPGHTVEKYEEFLDLIEKLLIFDPKERISAKDALTHPYLMPDGGNLQTWAAQNNANKVIDTSVTIESTTVPGVQNSVPMVLPGTPSNSSSTTAPEGATSKSLDVTGVGGLKQYLNATQVDLSNSNEKSTFSSEQVMEVDPPVQSNSLRRTR